MPGHVICLLSDVDRNVDRSESCLISGSGRDVWSWRSPIRWSCVSVAMFSLSAIQNRPRSNGFVDDFMLHQIDMLHVNTNMTFYFILAQPEFFTDALPHNSVSLNGLQAFKTSLRFLLQFIIFITINWTTSLLLKMLNYPHTWMSNKRDSDNRWRFTFGKCLRQ